MYLKNDGGANMEEKICCFTGHRIKKLNMNLEIVKILLEKAIDETLKNGCFCFISGMAEGIDIFAAEIVLRKKAQNEKIKLWCALPYPSFKAVGGEDIKNLFEEIISKADRVEAISDHYFKGCFQKRNKWMVDNSTEVIAFFNGEESGTKNTIDYAKKTNKIVNNIWNDIIKTK